MKATDLNKILDHWPAKVLALAVAILLFLFHRFDSLQTRTYTVPLRLMTDTTLVPAQDYDHRVRVTVRGADEVVAQVTEADLEALSDFSGHQGEGVFRAPIQVNRKGAAQAAALEVSVDPLVLSLHLERKVVKNVPVRPDFVGQPGRNFELAGFQVVPSVITIEGPRSAVEKVPSVTTEPIELRGKTDSFTLKARVESGSSVLSFPYGNTVEVQGLMSSSLASLVLEAVSPGAINLAPNLRIETPLPAVRVRVRGTPTALEGLGKDDQGSPTVTLIADLAGYTQPGEIPALELKASLPEGVELVDLSPAVVPVALVPKGDS